MKWRGDGEGESTEKFTQIYIQKWRSGEYRYTHTNNFQGTAVINKYIFAPPEQEEIALNHYWKKEIK